MKFRMFLYKQKLPIMQKTGKQDPKPGENKTKNDINDWIGLSGKTNKRQKRPYFCR